jgi:hypothetical protein
MRVKFNTFDTHSDINNIIDIFAVSFRYNVVKNSMEISIVVLNPNFIIANVNDTGTLYIEDTNTNLILFNSNVILNSLSIHSVKETNMSFLRYTYTFTMEG